MSETLLESARRVAGAVLDPEVPVLTIEDLGVLRDLTIDAGGAVEVTITPTYSGCPAMDAIRADIVVALAAHGYHDVAVRTELAPAWTTDWMSEDGRRKLREYGIAPPGPGGAGPARSGPVPITLGPLRPAAACPRCGSPDTRLLSRFSSTACKALRSCNACLEPFDHFKEL